MLSMTQLWPHLCLAIRVILRRPGSSVVVVTTLALAIGANTAIFSLLNAIALRRLPIPHPEQLVALGTSIPDRRNPNQPLSFPMFLEIARVRRGMSGLFAWNSVGIVNFQVGTRTIAAALASASGDYYRTMQITPYMGRFITRSDVALGNGTSSAVAVISYRAWRNWYQGSSEIIGKPIRIQNQRFTIIGVEPKGYSGIIIDASADVTIPLFALDRSQERDLRKPQFLWLRVYGRLASRVTVIQARTALLTVWPHILEVTRPPAYTGDRKARFFARRLTVESAALGVSSLRNSFSYSLHVLLALALAVLLVACLNLANLSLVRAAARRYEFAVRAALGASVCELTLQPVVESLILSVAGGVFGLVLGYWISQGLLHIAWTNVVSTALSISPDLYVLAFTAMVAVLASVLLSLLPAWFIAQTDPINILKRQSQSVRSGPNFLSRGLALLQIVISMVLVVGAILFAQTLIRLHTANVGYRRDHLLTMRLFPQAENNSLGNSSSYYQDLAEHLKRLPGVGGVSFSIGAPANESEYLDTIEISEADSPVQAVDDFVGPKFFTVVGMRMLKGREFTWGDDLQKLDILIITQNLADRMFGHQDPIGRSVFLGPVSFHHKAKIIGVVSNASLWKVESREPMAFFQPITKTFDSQDPLVDIRTTVDPHTIKTPAEQVVRSLGRQYSLRTMTVEERLDSYITAQRLTAVLTGLFGGIALLIAAVGLYGLMSFGVTRRTAELGVRVALGAQPGQILSLVLGEALLLALVGCGLGILASLMMSRLIRSLLFGVSISNPGVLASASLILLLVALSASFVPARRAASLHPMTALRVE